MKKFILVLTIALLFIKIITSDLTPLPIPNAFYGNVYYSDLEPAESGKIIAKMKNIVVGEGEILNGVYSLIALKGQGNEIYFYLEGNDDEIAVYDFQMFEVTELDLIVPRQPSCFSDADCGSTFYSGSYCFESLVLTNFYVPKCYNHGEENSYCSNSIQQTVKSVCDFGCSGGSCVYQESGEFDCGNGIVEFSEECDDGNLVNEDGCSEFCRKEEYKVGSRSNGKGSNTKEIKEETEESYIPISISKELVKLNEKIISSSKIFLNLNLIKLFGLVFVGLFFIFILVIARR